MSPVLSTRAELATLASVRRFVEDACRPAALEPVNDARVAGLVLAVHEAAANMAEHAYRGAGGALRLASEWNGPTLVVRLWHDGEPVDRAAVPAPRFDGSSDRGFGTFLLEAAADRVLYESVDGRHGVRIEKTFLLNEGDER